MRPSTTELFHQVANLSQEARDRYFVELGVDERTRKEVEERLAQESATTKILAEEIVANHSERVELNGLHCGPYRLGNLLEMCIRDRSILASRPRKV